MRAVMVTLSLAAYLSASAALAQNPHPGCPTGAQATSGEASKTGPGGNERPEHQPVERSAIVPDAGGAGQSAAPTVQQDGKSVVAETDCPKPPNRLDAKTPGG